jgi:broad specificity phosphatase PhoE
MTSPKRRRIILMRHGSVTYFDDAGMPYPPDAVPLNEQGRAQADSAGKLFASEALRFDRVIVSGLPRTVETAHRVLAQTGQRIEIEEWPLLTEIRGGQLSAIPDAMLTEAFTGAFSGVASENTRFLGGETIGELMDRVHPCVDRLREDQDWNTALLVLHGGVNRALLSYALAGQRLFLGNLGQTAGCINVLDVGKAPADWVVRVVNYSPVSALQEGLRGTTMETVLAQYRKSRGL